MTDTTEPKPIGFLRSDLRLAESFYDHISFAKIGIFSDPVYSAETVQQLHHKHKEEIGILQSANSELVVEVEQLQQRCDRLLAALKVAISSVDNYATKGRIGVVMTSRKLAEIKDIIAEAEKQP